MAHISQRSANDAINRRKQRQVGDVTVKSTGTLIDELLTTLIKCWVAQERVMTSTDDAETARAARMAQETNARRNALVRAIDERLGEGEITALLKTYTPEEIRKRFEENS